MSNNTLNELPESQRLRIEAEHYRLGMNVGFYTREQVIAWADSMLGTDAPPIPEIIELSLMNHPDVEEIVWQIRGGYRESADMRLPIARLFAEMAAGVRSGEREPERVARQVYGVAFSNYDMLTDIAPDALVVDEYFSPYCHWIEDDPVALLLEFLNRASCLLREDV